MSTGLKSADARKKKKKKKSTKRVPKASHGLAKGLLDAAIYSRNGDAEQAFAVWAKYLLKRKSPTSLRKLIASGGEAPLVWCVSQSQRELLLSRKWLDDKSPRKWSADELIAQAELWLARSTSTDATGALDALAWCYRLPQAASLLPRKQWNNILNELIRLARQSSNIRPNDGPWAAQLFLCELPLALGYNFPEVATCKELLRTAAQRMSESIVELCDGQGMPAVENIGSFHLLLACWTRCVAMIQATKKLKLDKDAQNEFEWFVRNALRLTRVDGGLPFGPAGLSATKSGFESVVQTALQICRDTEDIALSKLVIRNRPTADRHLPEHPGYHSEWAQVVIMQPGWGTDQPRLTIDFSQPTMRTELMAHGEILFSTAWNPEIIVDDVTLETNGAMWETTCWFADFDVDYVELEQKLSDQWTLQRQFLMARQDLFLFVADNLIGPETSQIRYRLSVPCSDGIRVEGSDESREGFIQGRRSLAAVLPIALSEWRSDPRHGEFLFHDNAMTLVQESYGKALTAPLFFDFHKNRFKKPLTWRQLTVAENLQIVTRDQAVGYRVQVGPEQWIVYRSLNEIGNRTLIGQNFSSEFICARFLDDGDIESLVEIE